MKKKILNILLIGIIVIGLTGCGNNEKKASIQNTSDEGNTKMEEKSIEDNVITCIHLRYSDEYDSYGEVYIYKNKKLYQWQTSKTIIKGASKEELEKHCGTENESSYGRVNIIEGDSCYKLFDFEKMTSSDLAHYPLTKELRERTIEEEFEKLKDDRYSACELGNNEIIKVNPKKIEGNYQATNAERDNSGKQVQIAHNKFDIKFENGKFYYELNGNNYSGTYTYDGKKLVLSSENEDAISFNDMWYSEGEFIVYEKIGEDDLIFIEPKGEIILRLKKK